MKVLCNEIVWNWIFASKIEWQNVEFFGESCTIKIKRLMISQSDTAELKSIWNYCTVNDACSGLYGP